MVLLTSTGHRYGFLAVTPHWTMAALQIVFVVMGLYMVSLPDAGFDVRKVTLILFHRQLGIMALALAAARMTWRISNPACHVAQQPKKLSALASALYASGRS
jgi:cytochrome b561